MRVHYYYVSWYSQYRTSHHAPYCFRNRQIHEGACRLCYAESADGLTWVKPMLGLIEFQGLEAHGALSPPPPSLAIYGGGAQVQVVVVVVQVLVVAVPVVT